MVNNPETWSPPGDQELGPLDMCGTCDNLQTMENHILVLHRLAERWSDYASLKHTNGLLQGLDRLKLEHLAQWHANPSPG